MANQRGNGVMPGVISNVNNAVLASENGWRLANGAAASALAMALLPASGLAAGVAGAGRFWLAGVAYHLAGWLRLSRKPVLLAAAYLASFSGWLAALAGQLAYRPGYR